MERYVLTVFRLGDWWVCGLAEGSETRCGDTPEEAVAVFLKDLPDILRMSIV